VYTNAQPSTSALAVRSRSSATVRSDQPPAASRASRRQTQLVALKLRRLPVRARTHCSTAKWASNARAWARVNHEYDSLRCCHRVWTQPTSRSAKYGRVVSRKSGGGTKSASNIATYSPVAVSRPRVIAPAL
jgi:hypothetical protein